jgi:hypothetical protein
MLQENFATGSYILQTILEKGVFFAISDPPFQRFHYASACLVEGLLSMGIPVYSNCELPGAQAGKFHPQAHGLYIFNITERSAKSQVLDFLKQFSRREKILLSMSDTNSSIFPAESYPSLMTHENSFFKLAGDRRPWAFGLSRQILEKTKNPPSFKKRRRNILRNFRPSNNQDVRNFLDFSFVDVLEKKIPVDRNLGSDYFERLLNNMGCLAYGGAIVEDRSTNPFFANDPNYQALSENREFLRPLVVARWDSWRFWESLAAGCITFHLDFEKYGFLLPVMPEPWRHYIPIDMADPMGTVQRFLDFEDRWEEISWSGREWAIENYGPEAVASRLLQTAAQEF